MKLEEANAQLEIMNKQVIKIQMNEEELNLSLWLLCLNMQGKCDVSE